MEATHRPVDRRARAAVVASGAALFARYAYPPGDVGYTVADHARELRDYAPRGLSAQAMGQQLRAYVAALPSLTRIAQALGVDDPLDAAAVEAYWVGSAVIEDIAALHHNASVFTAAPWVPMLTGQDADRALHVLDQCRVRWGRVIAVTAQDAQVRSRPLILDRGALALGQPRTESVRIKPEGGGSATRVQRGDWCAMHWNWLGDRLTTRHLVQLRRVTRWQMDEANARLGA